MNAVSRARARRSLKRVIPPPILRARQRLLSLPYKVALIRRYGAFRREPKESLRWILLGRELDNFTYEITNEGELARFLESAAAIPASEAVRYIDELQADVELRNAIADRLRGRPDRDRSMPYGRRLGWYAITRARKPSLVVETGVHDGLGSAVLLRALARNAAEGSDGILVSFDVREDAGWLIPDFLRPRHQLELRPAPEALDDALAGRSVGLFIHDSDHRYEHETAEFEAILPLATRHAALLSDNAHGGTAFRDFCERHQLPYHFFREVPADHWYPGAGIGLTTLQ